MFAFLERKELEITIFSDEKVTFRLVDQLFEYKPIVWLNKKGKRWLIAAVGHIENAPPEFVCYDLFKQGDRVLDPPLCRIDAMRALVAYALWHVNRSKSFGLFQPKAKVNGLQLLEARVKNDFITSLNKSGLIVSNS